MSAIRVRRAQSVLILSRHWQCTIKYICIKISYRKIEWGFFFGICRRIIIIKLSVFEVFSQFIFYQSISYFGFDHPLDFLLKNYRIFPSLPKKKEEEERKKGEKKYMNSKMRVMFKH